MCFSILFYILYKHLTVSALLLTLNKHQNVESAALTFIFKLLQSFFFICCLIVSCLINCSYIRTLYQSKNLILLLASNYKNTYKQTIHIGLGFQKITSVLFVVNVTSLSCPQIPSSFVFHEYS